MADQKISQLNSLTGANTASGDLVTIVDISDTTMGASGTNKKMTLTEFQAAPVSAGTANGVVFLNGSKVETSGSALTFDGTNLGVGTASPGARLVVQQANNTADGIRLFANGNDSQLITRYISGSDVWQITASFGSTGAYKPITWWTSDTERMRLDASGNLGIGTTTFGTSAAGVLSIANGTAPTTGPADTVQLFSVDRSAGNTIPAVRCEGSGVTNAGITNTTVTHKIAMQVNGTIYYLLATTNAT
jgi:hypothetical protein